MRFVYLGSRFTLRASSPRSVALAQLRFACLAVASSAEDLHLQDRAHAGRTRNGARGRRFPMPEEARLAVDGHLLALVALVGVERQRAVLDVALLVERDVARDTLVVGRLGQHRQ